MHKLCPVCHTWMSTSIFQSHMAAHFKLPQSGPMPFQPQGMGLPQFGSQPIVITSAKEPRTYVHPKCGSVTAIPDELLHSFARDPFLYNETSFCTGCGTYVSTGELFWQGTNESLLAAGYRQRAEFIQKNGLRAEDFVWDAQGPSRRKASSSGGWMVPLVALGGVAALLLVGVGLSMVLLHAARQARNTRQSTTTQTTLPFGTSPLDDDPSSRIDNRLVDYEQHINEILEDNRRRMEEMMRPPEFPSPFGEEGSDPFPRFNRGPLASGESPLDDARQRADEARERARKIQEESRQRMDAIRDRMRRP